MQNSNKDEYLITDKDDLEYPLYVIHSDNVDLVDGILWLDDQVLDDRNMVGNSLGRRRLQSPMNSLYNLKYQIEDIRGLMKHRQKTFIDTNGNIFNYEKTDTVQIKYHKIKKREKKEVATVLWLKGCPFPFSEKRPPADEITWAGVMYKNGIPWHIYDFAEEEKKATWRKI